MPHFYNRSKIGAILQAKKAPLQTYKLKDIKGVVPNFPLARNQEFQVTCQGTTWDEVARKLKFAFPGDAND